MTTFRQLAIQIKSYISRNDTRSAVQDLRAALQGHPEENTIIIRAGQQYGLQQELLRGTLAWEQANISQNQIHEALLKLVDQLAQEEIGKTKVFISYNRESTSAALAQHLRQRALKDGFQVFMDVEDIAAGADWAATILEELRSCHYFILLLSEKANNSEMVIKETELANRFRQETGKPITIPIRVQFPFEKRLNHRLHTLLQRIHQLEWKSEADTTPVMEKVFEVLHCRKLLPEVGVMAEPEAAELAEIEGAAPTPIAPLEVGTGAVRLDSQYYVTRAHEEAFIRNVELPGAILRIRGPRQYGKTSLLARIMAYALEKSFQVVTIDFQEIERSTFGNLEKLLLEFCSYFAYELDVEDKLQQRLTNTPISKQVCTAFLEKDILRTLDQPLLLALDEADRLFAYPEVSSEFFLLLRSWHEKSKLPNQRNWEKFRLVLSYSTEAKLAIQDINASPFNVGEEAKLWPFNVDQVADLAQRHGLNWPIPKLETILNLIGGQPYLTRRAMYLVAKGEYSFEQLIEQADRHDGPFSDHLRHHLINVRQYEDIAEAMRDILEKGKCKDPIKATRLEAAGLVKGSPPDMEPSCDLYARYFRGKL